MTKLTTWCEFINETLLVLVCYHYMLFVDLVPDASARDKIGYSLSAALGLLLVWNIGMMLWYNLSTAARSFKLWQLKKKQK